MSALTYQQGGKLTTLVEAQRGMTDAEALAFLQSGEVPDLSQPPVEVEPPNLTVQIMSLDAARRWLSGETGVPLVASSFLALNFNPNQPRDDDGKWTDGAPGGVSDGSLSTAQLKERGQSLERLLRKYGHLATDRTHATSLSKDKGVVWSAERDAIHRQIVDELYTKASDVPNDGEAIIVGGPSGAGKTTTIQRHAGVDLDRYLIINPDDAKEILAERGLVPEIPGHPELSPLERSALVHAESHRIATMLSRRAYQDRKNVIWDITMSSLRKTGAHITDLDRAGYNDISSIVVHVSPATSRRRVYARYGEGVNAYRRGDGLGGRFVPAGALVTQFHKERSWAWTTLMELKDDFDSWRLYDNSVDGDDPTLIKKSG